MQTLQVCDVLNVVTKNVRNLVCVKSLVLITFLFKVSESSQCRTTLRLLRRKKSLAIQSLVNITKENNVILGFLQHKKDSVVSSGIRGTKLELSFLEYHKDLISLQSFPLFAYVTIRDKATTVYVGVSKKTSVREQLELFEYTRLNDGVLYFLV